MKSENANFTHEYNSALDILYLMLDKTEESYGHEDDYGVVLNPTSAFSIPRSSNIKGLPDRYVTINPSASEF